MERFKKWAQREYNFWQRFLVTFLAGVIFIFLIPYTLVALAPVLDRKLNLSPIPIGLLVRSWSALGVGVLFSGLLILYLKTIEELELEARFGEQYLKYKNETPFLIPKFPLW